jgi:hypothetical protein
MIVNAGANPARLEVSGEDKLQVTNELGGVVAQLVVRDAAGAFHFAKDVAIGQPTPLASVPAEEIATVLTNLFVLGREDPIPASGVFYGTRIMYYDHYFDLERNLPTPTMTTSILQRKLSELGVGIPELPPNSYIALVRNPTWLPVGVANAHREACFDIVFGRW